MNPTINSEGTQVCPLGCSEPNALACRLPKLDSIHAIL